MLHCALNFQFQNYLIMYAVLNNPYFTPPNSLYSALHLFFAQPHVHLDVHSLFHSILICVSCWTLHHSILYTVLYISYCITIQFWMLCCTFPIPYYFMYVCCALHFIFPIASFCTMCCTPSHPVGCANMWTGPFVNGYFFVFVIYFAMDL